MTADRDDESGKFTEQYPRKAFLQAVDELDTPTTTNVAIEVGCSYDLAYRRLKALEEEGEVNHTEVGSTFIWSE